MANATEIKFSSEETFVLGLFVKVHSGKSWVTFKETSNSIVMAAAATGKEVKTIEITKASDTGFQVEITSGHFVRCHMHWLGSLANLLRRMELELNSPEFQEDRL